MKLIADCVKADLGVGEVIGAMAFAAKGAILLGAAMTGKGIKFTRDTFIEILDIYLEDGDEKIGEFNEFMEMHAEQERTMEGN